MPSKESTFNIEKQHNNIESKLIVTFEKISEAFRVLLWSEAHAFKLSPIQLQMLIFIKYHSVEKSKVGYLAQEFNMSKGTISDSVRVLIKKNLLEKEADPKDSRSFFLKLTKDGSQLAAQVDGFEENLRIPLLDLPTEKKEILLDSMMMLILKLQKNGIISLQRMCYTCNFYKNSSDAGQYCTLLKEKLTLQNLRVDCPEHMVMNINTPNL